MQLAAQASHQQVTWAQQLQELDIVLRPLLLLLLPLLPLPPLLPLLLLLLPLLPLPPLVPLLLLPISAGCTISAAAGRCGVLQRVTLRAGRARGSSGSSSWVGPQPRSRQRLRRQVRVQRPQPHGPAAAGLTAQVLCSPGPGAGEHSLPPRDSHACMQCRRSRSTAPTRLRLL